MNIPRAAPSPYLRRPAGRSKAMPPNARPGDKAPRKSLTTSLEKYDWRAELAVDPPFPRSVPCSAGNTVTLVDRAALPFRPGSAGMTDRLGAERRVEVGLEGLIEDGRGKREKRATTATTLGFDFIPNPSITALPDTPARDGDDTPLGVTPRTPGLVREPALAADDEGEDEDEDDGWERISAVSESHTTTPSIVSGRADDDDHESIIVLGELELEDAPQLPLQTSGKHESPAWPGGKVSYAAALGKTSAA